MKEQEVLLTAFEKIEKLIGATVKRVKAESKIDNDFVDAVIELNVKEKKSILKVEVRNELRSGNLPQILNLSQKHGNNWLLISQYIPKPIKEELKSRKINYLETAGNCYIETENIYIYINDQAVSATRLAVEGKLWRPSGLKFLFTILQSPQSLNISYRQLARVSGIALGSIGLLYEELKREGFLKEGIQNNGKVFFIEGKDRLLQRWAEAFRGTLRPKLIIGNFRFMDKNTHKDWEEVKSDNFKWGGENAGALLTNYLQPEKFTIYSNESKLNLMQELKLIPDANGNVEILSQFWTDELYDPNQKLNTIPPLLAYAELITSYDSRNRESAERIKTQYLD